MTNAILMGQQHAGNPRVRLDEGKAASAKPRRGPLLYNKEVAILACLTVSLSALAATTVVDPPARAIASYASESKAVVNARGLSSAMDNAKSMRLKGRGIVLIVR